MAYSLPYTDGATRLPVITKCPECKKSTKQEFIVITPVNPDQLEDPLDLIKKAKRLTICTECGNLRLAK